MSSINILKGSGQVASDDEDRNISSIQPVSEKMKEDSRRTLDRLETFGNTGNAGIMDGSTQSSSELDKINVNDFSPFHLELLPLLIHPTVIFSACGATAG